MDKLVIAFNTYAWGACEREMQTFRGLLQPNNRGKNRMSNLVLKILLIPQVWPLLILPKDLLSSSYAYDSTDSQDLWFEGVPERGRF